MSQPGPAFSVKSLSVRLGESLVLSDVNLNIAPSRWTCIVGPNGAGKSTLVKAIAALLPYQGNVQLLGRSLKDWPARERAQTLSWLGQNEIGGDDLCVWDVVMLGRLPHQGFLSTPNAEDRAAVADALHLTHSWDWRHRSVNQLSGGERQRVLLARALAVQAQVMLMDEPLLNLDPPHQADWLAIIRGLVNNGKTIVSVLHEVSMALHADDILVLAQGRIAHQGASSDSQTHRAIEHVFDQRLVIRSLEDQWVALPVIKTIK